MRAIIVFVALVALVTATAVKDTTDADFETVIASHEFVMMEFYAPWCGHCKKLEPEYEQAATQLGDKAVLARLDATAETKSAGKFEVKGFPTIKIFRDGKLAGDYEGGRSAADFVKYVNGNVGPAVKPATDAAALEALKSESDVLLVIFTTDSSSATYKAFEEVAKEQRSNYAFAATGDVHIPNFAEGRIVVFKKFDDKEATFEGEATKESLTAFLKSEGIRTFDEIGPENYRMYLSRGLPMAWFFTDAAQEDKKKIASDAAANFKGKASFVWIDSSKYGGMAQRLGLSGNKFPAFAIDLEGTHYAYDEDADLTTEGLVRFTQDYLDGKLKQTVRSEPTPAEHTVDGLTTVVGNTFTELVAEADTDVFIEFYAPWCGHCKKLAPEYAKLAKQLADAPVRIAQIDATANDFDQKKFAVQGFPTLMFIPKTTHQPIPFEGDRSQAGMLKFIKEKATSPINDEL